METRTVLIDRSKTVTMEKLRVRQDDLKVLIPAGVSIYERWTENVIRVTKRAQRVKPTYFTSGNLMRPAEVLFESNHKTCAVKWSEVKMEGNLEPLADWYGCLTSPIVFNDPPPCTGTKVNGKLQHDGNICPIHEEIEITDLASMKAADPKGWLKNPVWKEFDSAEGHASNCPVQIRTKDGHGMMVVCTRPIGHDGPHIARNNWDSASKVLEVWDA